MFARPRSFSIPEFGARRLNQPGSGRLRVLFWLRKYLTIEERPSEPYKIKTLGEDVAI